MALYSSFKYNDGTLYGDGSTLDYSARPMVATATNYTQVYLEYNAPTGSYIQFRITRNQDGYPETAEDGKIIYETSIGNYPTGDRILDTSLVSGKFVYYRAWLRRSPNAYWEPAGEIITLVPFKHTLTSGTNAVESAFIGKGIMGDAAISAEVDFSTTHQRFLSYLPRVLTSTTMAPVDEINTDYYYSPSTAKIDNAVISDNNSLISKFFEGFSFTIDEFLSFAKLIIPDNNGASSSPEILELKSFELGIKSYNKLATKAQKRLVRDALTIYGGKGTLNSLKLFAKDLTGYEVTATETSNIMLSHEDSTFDIEDWTVNSTIGSWVPGDGVTLAVTSDKTIATGITNSLDLLYCLKVTTTGSSQSLSYGTNRPINNAIPVTASTAYTLSTYVQGPSNITLNILWYTYQGKFISTSSGSSVSTNSSWTRKTLSATAPSSAVYAALRVDFASTGSSIYYFDMVQFEQAASVSSYVEPRAVTLSLSPTKYNYILNPSFEVSTSGVPNNWTFTNVTPITVDTTLDLAPGTNSMVAISTPSTFSGTYLGTVQSSYTGALLTTKFYTYSIYAKSISGNQNVTMVLSDGTVTSTKTIALTDAWQRFSVSISCKTVPTTLTIKVTTSNLSSEFFLDSAQLEQGSITTDYFDGNRDYSGGAWTNTVNASVSAYYPNLSLRIAHLMDSIKDYLPISTPYYVTFYGSTSFTDVALSGIS
jgi:hypothetical protein